MEALPDKLYGESLRLVIPRLEIKNLDVKNSVSLSCFSLIEPLTLSAPQPEEPDRGDALNHVIQTNPQVRLIVEANEAIVLMINSFVDFFIQYYQYYYHAYNVELNPLILRLKEIIFYSTNQSALANDYNEFIGLIKSKLDLSRWPEWEEPKSYFFPKNVGREFLYNSDYIESSKKKLKDLTQVFIPAATEGWHKKQLQEEVDAINLYLDDKLFIISTTSKFQKFEIFSLLFLSYHVLSTSGFFFTIEIKDLDEILLQEIARGNPNSFILQFLPHDPIIINIIKSNLLQFFMMKSEIYMPALRELQLEARTTMPALQRLLRGEADAGGSKRLHNKSRKNKYKHKYNYKYKKSRKNKRHRRKRTQSNQNKIF
jgi:hypothetical protein